MNEPTPIEYFKRCITSGYTEFGGRARRAEYWNFRLFMILCYLPFIFITLVGLAFETPALTVIGLLLAGLLAIAFWLPNMAVSVRRFHDTGKSGWLYLLAFVPGGGIVIFIFVVLEGDRGPNLYGPDPKPRTGRGFTDRFHYS